VVLNYIAVRKIVKKFDKNTGNTTPVPPILAKQSFYNSLSLAKLITKTEIMVAKHNGTNLADSFLCPVCLEVCPIPNPIKFHLHISFITNTILRFSMHLLSSLVLTYFAGVVLHGLLSLHATMHAPYVDRKCPWTPWPTRLIPFFNVSYTKISLLKFRKRFVNQSVYLLPK
jgi:hypothetical protein